VQQCTATVTATPQLREVIEALEYSESKSPDGAGMNSGSFGDVILRLKAICIRRYLREADQALRVADLEPLRIEKSMLAERSGRNEESMLAARSRWNERSQRLDSWRQRLEDTERRIQGTVQPPS